MAYNWLNVENPYFWLLFCGLFVGASISRATRPIVRADRWSFVYLLLALGVAAAACAFVVPNLVAGRHVAFAPRLPVYTAVLAAAGYLGTRFKLAAGIPILLVAALWVIAAGASTRGFNSAPGDATPIGTLRVLSAAGRSIHVEVDVPPAAPEVRVMAADAVAPVARVVSFDEAYFFLNSSRFYRFGSLEAFNRRGGGWDRAPADDVVEAPPPRALPSTLPPLPGETKLTLTVEPFVPAAMASYALTLRAGGTGGAGSLRLAMTEDAANP